MGVATIVSNTGEGLYTVTINKDLERATKERKKAQTDINSLELNVLTVRNLITNLNVKSITIQNRIDQTISDIQALNLPPEEEFEQIKKDTAEDIKLREETNVRIRTETNKLAGLKISISTKQKFIALVQVREAEVDSRSLWCCDYKTDLIVDEVIESADIARENVTVFIAPYTYVVAQDDIDRLTDIILVKNVKLTDIESQITANTVAKDAANLNIRAKVEELNTTQNIEQRNIIREEINVLTMETMQLASDAKALLEIKDDFDTQIAADTAEKSELTTVGVGSIIVPVVTANTKKIQPVISNGAPGTFFNKSLLPGVQRYIPTYRTGVLTALTGDVATVLLDEARSSQKSSLSLANYNINYDPLDKDNLTPTLTNVPVKYGDCNGAVFAVDDTVLVEYKERAVGSTIVISPQVIGFTNNPKPCTIILARHALGKIYQYFSDAAKDPVLIFDLLSVSGAQISPLTLIQGFAVKGADVYTAVNGTISKNGTAIGTTTIANPFFMACSQSDDFIFISGFAVSNTDINIEKFNIVTNTSAGVIVNEATVGSGFAVRVATNRIAQLYYNSGGNLVFAIWQKDGTHVLDVAASGAVGVSNWIAAYKDMFAYTTSTGSVYTYNFLTEDGISFGSVTPPMADVHPGLDFGTYSLGAINITNKELWLLSVVNGGFSFWTVYQLDITYTAGVPSAVVLGNGGAFLFQKTALVGSEYTRSDGWIHGQTA